MAPFAGTVIAVAREADEPIGQGEALVVLEAMKMEHEILAEVGGRRPPRRRRGRRHGRRRGSCSR